MKDGVVHDLHGYDVVEEVEVAHHTIVFDEHMDDNDENILQRKQKNCKKDKRFLCF